NVVRPALAQVGAEDCQDILRPAEATAAAQAAQVEPARQPFIEVVGAPPAERPGRDVDVAEVGQPNHRRCAPPWPPGAWTPPDGLRTISRSVRATTGCIPLPACSIGGVGSMPKVEFVNEKKEIEVEAGANLRQEAMKAGIQVYQGIDRYLHCPGLGLC